MNPLQAQIYRLGDRLYQEALSLPSRLAFTCANQPWVEQFLLRPQYHRAIAHHNQTLPALSSEEQTIVQALDEYGLYVTHLDHLALPHQAQLWQAGQQLTQQLRDRAQTPLFAGKHTLTATAQDFLDHPILLTWAINETLLRIAEHYFRLPVAYDGPSFYYSIANGNEAGPRRWHRDKEDWKMLKVAIYFTDVDLTGGPFECLSPPANQALIQNPQLKNRIFHHQALAESLPTPQTTPAAAPNKRETWYQSCIGKAGTVVLCDTAHYFHRGRPPIAQDRSAIFYSFFSRRPKHPFLWRSPLSLAQIHQFAPSLPPHQAACLTWPQNLPILARLIPKNRVRV